MPKVRDHKPFLLSFLAVLALFISSACTQRSDLPLRQREPLTQIGKNDQGDVVIAAVGDIMMSGSVQSVAARSNHNYDILFERIAKDLKAADITFANLETPVDHTAAVSGYPKFNARPELLKAIKRAGIDVLSMANNHVMDAGVEGLTRTLGNIESAGLVFVGAGRTKAEAKKIKFVASHGMKVAFLAYTYDVNQRLPGKKASAPGVNVLRSGSAQDLSQAAERVRVARKSADVVVVSLHWGDEYRTDPTAWQRQVAAGLVEAGADIILGHHPHVLQPIETCPAKDGRRGLVVYSLGNFISGQNAGIAYHDRNSSRALRGDGIVLSIVIGREGGRAAVQRAEFLPIWTLHEVAGKAVVPRPVSIAREIAKLESAPRRNRDQENLLHFLSHRQKLITEKLAVSVQ
jgi:poly-gamma-glutamate synthesis protein (capsule biosynthesis protein)